MARDSNPWGAFMLCGNAVGGGRLKFRAISRPRGEDSSLISLMVAKNAKGMPKRLHFQTHCIMDREGVGGWGGSLMLLRPTWRQ